MRLVEALAFLTLASGLHLGAWIWAQDGGGAGGQQADASNSTPPLAAAAQTYVELVAQWDQTPNTAQVPIAPTRVTQAVPPPDVPKNTETAPKQLDRPEQTLAQTPATRLPTIPEPTPRLVTPKGLTIELTSPRADIAPIAAPQIAALRLPEQRSTQLSQPKVEQFARDTPQIDLSTPEPDGPLARSLRPRLPTTRPQRVQDSTPTPKAAAQTKRKAASKSTGQTGTAPKSKPRAKAAAVGTPKRSTKQRDQLRARWHAQIAQRVHLKLSQLDSAVGNIRVTLVITVARSGKLMDVKLSRPSGRAAFDADALRATKQVRRFPKAPKGLTDPAHSFRVSVRVNKS